ELVDVLNGSLTWEGGLLFDDGVECGINVFGHAGGIAADVDAGAFLKPCVEVGGLLEHAVLDVDLSVLIAGESEIEPGEMPVRVHGLEFFLIEKVGGGAAFSEEEPVAAGVAEGSALVQEAAERGNAGSWTDQDDRSIGIFWQAELFVWLNVDGQSVAGGNAIGEQCRADATAVADVRTIANDSYGCVNLSSVRVRAGGDGVEAWREARQHRDEVRRIVQNAGVIVEEVD